MLFRKKAQGKGEIEFIERIEKRIEWLIKDWDESYNKL